MLMRLVRDEPDVELDVVRAEGAENDASVLSDLQRTAAGDEILSATRRGMKTSRAGKARTPMSRKSPSQVIAVPEFGAPDEQFQDGPAAGQSPEPGAGDAPPQPVLDEMSDGAIPPQEPPLTSDAADDESDTGSADVDVPLATLEALLLSTHHPLTPARLSELLAVGSTRAIRHAVQTLNQSYEQTGRSFRIEQVAGGYQILTLPEHGDALRRLHQKDADAKLTKAALETLSIIAYKQPILRADIEAIRGVACGETIRSLMEKHLVKIAGRAEEPGRPILYGTTKRFLELFGLNSLKDLPKPEDFKPAGN